MLDGAEQQARWLRAAEREGARELAAEPVVPPPGERPWDRAVLAAAQQQYRDHGLELVAVEDTPPMDRVRLGLPGRDQEIEWVLDQIAAMGGLGIRGLCYNWMALTSWARTATAVPVRGGALSTGFSESVSAAAPPLVEQGAVTADQLWDALAYFLAAVVPAAEEAGVRLGLHPDDPRSRRCAASRASSTRSPPTEGSWRCSRARRTASPSARATSP